MYLQEVSKKCARKYLELSPGYLSVNVLCNCRTLLMKIDIGTIHRAQSDFSSHICSCVYVCTFLCVSMKVKLAQLCLTLCDPMGCPVQSMEFSRPEYWSGQPFPSPGDHPNPGIKPRSLVLLADSLPAEPQGKREPKLTQEQKPDLIFPLSHFYRELWNTEQIATNAINCLLTVLFWSHSYHSLCPPILQ